MKTETANNTIKKDTEIPVTEVSTPRRRKYYTQTEKRRILAKYDQCSQPGEIGELLRQEGIYSSSITRWKREFDSQANKAEDQKDNQRDLRNRIRQLERANKTLEKRLHQAETVIEVQKKIVTMYGSEDSTE